jgi:dihydropteroate synthase/2-amino-4-hydroxy-6-hydroxymethyldihydropteridine diphosphokinase
MADLHTVYIAMGTNLGMRAANLRAALAGLLPDVRVRRVSPIYETPPWGYLEQPAFLNQVVEAETSLLPQQLLALLKNLETDIGREPTFPNGPRLIDLDVLFYDDQVIEVEDLAIPHPRMEGRAFVLVPMADLAPDLKHPVLGKSIRELAAETDPTGMRKVMAKLPAFGCRTFVMGVLNITPDSFSGDGILQGDEPIQAALEQAHHFVKSGVDILDIGGESTRPGAQAVTEGEERRRVVPIIRALSEAFGGLDKKVYLSVDTYKAGVAEAALEAGADWINDVWGLRADPSMGEVAARYHAPVVLMHNRLKPNTTELQERLGGRYVGVQYDHLLEDIKSELLESVKLARAAGVPEEHIIVDPGIGFGKTVEQNLELIDRLDEICALGYPVLHGPSRKSFIGYTLDLPADQRLEGTAAAVAIGIDRGADIIRVHDVSFMVRLSRMTDALVRRRRAARPVKVG